MKDFHFILFQNLKGLFYCHPLGELVTGTHGRQIRSEEYFTARKK